MPRTIGARGAGLCLECQLAVTYDKSFFTDRRSLKVLGPGRLGLLQIGDVTANVNAHRRGVGNVSAQLIELLHYLLRLGLKTLQDFWVVLIPRQKVVCK